MRDLLWSTFLPWVRVPGTPTYRRLSAEPPPADLGDYRPYDAPHEPPGATVDDTRARAVARKIVAAEPDRVAEVSALLDRIGLDHGPEPEAWDAIGARFADRVPDDATPSLVLDLGLLLGRRIIDARPEARWEADDEAVLAYPQIVLGTTVIAVPLQAVERWSDLGAVLAHALDAEEADPEAEFVAYLREVLDARGDDLSADDLQWMLAESGLEDMPELPEDLEERLPARDPSS
ncbi:hypothetical protein [Actinomycetospora sp.]|uniref:hypothetical protein n=1 Tax=Actinomycetospora sp. TaxID=1872135 RepID=UPI002F41A260